MYSSSLLAIVFASLALARTDIAGCVSSETVRYGGASILWYVPGTGEICEALDCGGGRAPPKTTVAGCPSYEGTGIYSPSFIALATSTNAAASSPSSTAISSAMITGSPSLSTELSIIVASTTSDGGLAVEFTSTSSTLLPLGTSSPISNTTGTNSSSVTLAPTASFTSGGKVFFASMRELLVALTAFAFLL